MQEVLLHASLTFVPLVWYMCPCHPAQTKPLTCSRNVQYAFSKCAPAGHGLANENAYHIGHVTLHICFTYGHQ